MVAAHSGIGISIGRDRSSIHKKRGNPTITMLQSSPRPPKTLYPTSDIVPQDRWRGGGGKLGSIRGDGRAVLFPAVMARRRGGGAAVCERNRVEVVGSGWILAVE
ncbi:hypothetical protein PAHAL_2G457300 [Panicum hallii]|uniref:Uncharacterized protein n=1 Tax=Panicum hallii TaxID=206008 RepID=A0A2T8KT47_9POAL|nr:hypothetical protein PAHAL_2G457300 [Panicum hallii]